MVALRKLSLALFVFTAFSFAEVAFAEVSCPEARSGGEARRLAGREFSAGQRLYDRGSYEAAIERFECSYRLVPHRATLFNIARTAEAAGDDEEALESYRALLSRYPDDPDREDIEERARRIRRRLRAREPVAPPPPPRYEEPAPTEFGTGGDDDRRSSGAGSSRGRIAAWVTLGLGAAAAIAGGALIGVAASQNEAYLEHRDVQGWSREELFDAHQSGVALEGAGWALLGVGAASLVTSLVLFLTSRNRSSASARGRSYRFSLLPQPAGCTLVF